MDPEQYFQALMRYIFAFPFQCYGDEVPDKGGSSNVSRVLDGLFIFERLPCLFTGLV